MIAWFHGGHVGAYGDDFTGGFVAQGSGAGAQRKKPFNDVEVTVAKPRSAGLYEYLASLWLSNGEVFDD